MSRWGAAIAGGLAGAAGAGAQIIDQRLQEDADARMADRKLDLQQRLMAAEEAMKNRAAERFAAVARTKMGEEIPVEAPSVEQTGLSADSAAQVTTATGETINAAFTNPAQAMQELQAILDNPNADAQAKEYARAGIEGLKQQAAKQGEANAASVAGKTRPRSWKEAISAAREETAMSDPAAFMAGEAMFGQERKDDLAEMRLRAAERIKDKEIKSREKIEEQREGRRQQDATYRDEQAERRHQETLARLDARIEASGKGAAPTALRQNVELLKELGYGPELIEKDIFEKKEVPVEDIAAKLSAADPMLSPEEAAQKAKQIKASIGRSGTTAPASEGSGPKRLKYNPATGKVE